MKNGIETCLFGKCNRNAQTCSENMIETYLFEKYDRDVLMQ